MKDLHVIVVGAGMGGLALGLALHKAGISTALYEQAPELSEVGAGIMMTPNACRALTHLGAFNAVDAKAQRPGATHYRDYKTGQVISTVAYDEAFQRRYNGPYLTIHRADLQLALRDTLTERAAGILHLNHTLVDVKDTGRKVVAVFSNGAEVEGDLLVACDGVRSVAREKIFQVDAPRFQGNVAYRGMVAIEKLGADYRTTDTSTSVGPGQHLVQYTIKNGAFVNFVAISERDQWTEEGWSVFCSPDEVRQVFAGWNDNLTQLIDNTPADRLYKWGLFDREPLDRWVSGRVVLLGDAAHPTTPFMAQGAAMSFEDAVVLSRSIEQAGSIDNALATYEKARVERGKYLVLRSRFFGQLYHRQAPADEINAERRKANDYLYLYDAPTVSLTA